MVGKPVRGGGGSGRELTLRKRRVAKQADVWSGGKFGKGGGDFLESKKVLL